MLHISGNMKSIHVWDAEKEACVSKVPTGVMSCVTSTCIDKNLGNLLVAVRFFVVFGEKLRNVSFHLMSLYLSVSLFASYRALVTATCDCLTCAWAANRPLCSSTSSTRIGS